MHAFASAISLEIIDGMACALLAAAAACRARKLGAQIFGALILGFFCGLLAPLGREAVLHGQTGLRLIIQTLPAYALAGAFAGLAGAILHKSAKLFILLDGAGMGLAASLACALAAPELGVAGALALALGCGLAPGIARDVTLGDTAMLADKNWYGASCAIGCLASFCILISPAFFTPFPFLLTWLGECASLGGMLVTVGIWSVMADREV